MSRAFRVNAASLDANCRALDGMATTARRTSTSRTTALAGQACRFTPTSGAEVIVDDLRAAALRIAHEAAGGSPVNIGEMAQDIISLAEAHAASCVMTERARARVEQK
jgi:hypothetical protein